MDAKIKEMLELGYSKRRISKILKLPIEQINKFDIQISKELFDETKNEYICDLYLNGVSIKSLGIKFGIDKRRIEKIISQKIQLRDKNSSHRLTEFNETIFDIIDSEEKAYWLGFFYADAYNSDTINTFSIALKQEDHDHLVKLCEFIGLPKEKIRTYNSKLDGKEYPTCSLKLYSKHVCQKMIELGCPRAKSFIITFPEWLSKDLQVPFIRGMFDGDGSLCKRVNNEWKWSLATTKECGESIQYIILDQLKFIVNLSYISKTKNNTYELESNGNEKVLKLAEWLYLKSKEETRLDRKYSKYLELIDQQDNRSFIRNSYKVSDETKTIIYKNINEGKDIMSIASDNKLHQRTITKILSSKTLYDKIAIIDGKPITAQYVKTLNFDERNALVEPLFEYFRKQGWLYPDDPSKIKKNWQKLCDFKPDLTANDLFNNSSLCTDICKYFCHNFYEATERNKATMKEVFADDDKLRFLIKNRLGFDWWDKEDNDETFNISFRMLIQGMRSSRLVPSISIFKPNIAKYLYMKYSQEGDTVFDYSAGWGGRMLGAASCNRKYIGVDPLTTDELEIIKSFLDLKNVTLIKNGSEHIKLDENSIDFSFSSPPYFDQECYSADITQAYNKDESYFYDTYWANTLNNVKFMLKPGKWFGLNVKNYPKMLDMAIEIFGKPVEEVNLRTIRSHLNKSSGIEKGEPVYMFKNNK